MIVVFQGNQVSKYVREGSDGFHCGIMKSSDTFVQDQIINVKFLYLELGVGGLYEDANGISFAQPWRKARLCGTCFVTSESRIPPHAKYPC